MGSRNTPNRESVGCSLPPEKAARLKAEATARLLAPSVIIEAALDRLWADEDAKTADTPDV